VIYAYNYGNPEEFFNIFELSAFLSRTYLNQKMSDETWYNLITDLVFDTEEMEISMRTKNLTIGGASRGIVRATAPVQPLPGSPIKFARNTPLVFANNFGLFQQKSSLVNVVETRPDRRHSRDLVESNIQNNLNYLRGSNINSPMIESNSNYYTSQLSQASPFRTNSNSGGGFSGFFVTPVSPNNRASELPKIEENIQEAKSHMTSASDLNPGPPPITQMETMNVNFKLDDNYQARLQKTPFKSGKDKEESESLDEGPPPITQMETMNVNFKLDDNYQARLQKTPIKSGKDKEESESLDEGPPPITQMETMKVNFKLDDNYNARLQATKPP
jgi:hypothetical protein